MSWKVLRILFLFAVVMAEISFDQANPAQSSKAVPIEVVPIDKEPSHHLVFENEYVRVFSVEVAPHAETKYHQHDRDYVGVILGDSDVESVRADGTVSKIQLKDGETLFSKGGFAHKAVNNSDKPFKNVTVELKKDAGRMGCGAESGKICGAGAKGIDHPPASASFRQILRAENLVLTTQQLNGTRLSLDLCGENRLLVFSTQSVVWSSGDLHGGPDRKPGDFLWFSTSHRLSTECEFWSSGVTRFTELEFTETQDPSRQKEGAQDDKIN